VGLNVLGSLSPEPLRGKPENRIELAVVGGGPKAAAVAAKAALMRELNIAQIHVTIFEPHSIGANWRGEGGYTDGVQRLCTPAERDVGYPYDSMFGRELNMRMYERFSWPSFLQTRPPEDPEGFRAWVDGGRKPPKHQQFADYLSWVVARSNTPVIQARVDRLDAVGGKWRVLSRTGTPRLVPAARTFFDGVLITGPGPAKPFSYRGNPKFMLNGVDFWEKLGVVGGLIQKANARKPIVIMGAGGTGAACLAWMIANGARDTPISIIADQASLYTRVENVFDNRLFTDQTLWAALSPENQLATFNRLNRGVVWSTVMRQVETASALSFIPGRALAAEELPDRTIAVTVKQHKGEFVTPAAFVVDATGFNPWWFLKLIKGFPHASLADAGLLKRWERRMADGLFIRGSGWTWPRLHAPMVSSSRGPGYATVMVLGSMSDQVLGSYLT